MKTKFLQTRVRGFNLIELLLIVFILAVLAALFIPGCGGARAQSLRYQCMGNLKQIGLAFRVWEGDHGDKYPMLVSMTNGGTMELVESGTVFCHFQVMSNELSRNYSGNGSLIAPKILRCPADSKKQSSTSFITDLSDKNISYFVGVDAVDTNAQMLLSGDRNITNGTPMGSGLIAFTTNQLAGWTGKIHDRQGQIGMADGSVFSWNTLGLRATLKNTGVPTNRLAMP
jgi:competence protein ComGC